MAKEKDDSQAINPEQHPNEGAAATPPNGGAAAALPTYDPMRAKHEAAHAVVIDDLGYRVTRINIRPGEPQNMQANWGAFGEAMKTINRDRPAERDAIRPQGMGYGTMLVAGHLAENITDGKT